MEWNGLVGVEWGGRASNDGRLENSVALEERRWAVDGGDRTAGDRPQVG